MACQFIAEEACKRRGTPLRGQTVAVQGFGNVGGVAARMLAAAGARIVAVSDSRGGIYSESGLDVESLYAHRQAGGLLADHPGAGHTDVTNEELLELPVDILVPAALEGQVTEMNAGKIKAKMIVEAANGPVTPKADEILADRGIYVVPDIVANAGGVVVSYFEWVQDLQSFFWEENEVNTRLHRILMTAFGEVDAVAQERKLLLRDAAYVVAVKRVVAAIEARGIYP